MPLILGFAGLAGFLFFESQPRLAPQPTMPLHVMSNRTSATGFILAFVQTMTMIWPLFFLPVYFQGVLKASTTMSGVMLLPSILALIPGTAVGGAVMNKTGRYRPVQHAGFALVTIGFGLYSMLDEHSSTGWWIGFQILFSFGAGSRMSLPSITTSALAPEILLTFLLQSHADDAPYNSSTIGRVRHRLGHGLVCLPPQLWFNGTHLDFSLHHSPIPHLLSTTKHVQLHWNIYLQLVSQWGTAIPAAVFNTRFDQLAPSRITDQSVKNVLTQGQAYEHATAAFVNSLTPESAAQVRSVLSDSLKLAWQVGIALAGFAFLLVFVGKEVPLRKKLETDYGIVEKEKEKTADGVAEAEEGKA